MDLEDIQGNTLRGYRYPFAKFWFIRFRESEFAEGWLSRVAPQITTSEDWGSNRPSSTLNIAFTYRGLQALHVDSLILSSLPVEFREGMAARSEFLGDHELQSPTSWESPWHQEIERDRLHALVSIYGVTLEAIEERATVVFANSNSALSITTKQVANRLPEDREHFGFRDGISNPSIEGVKECDVSLQTVHETSTSTDAMAIGEFITGYAGQDGLVHRNPLPPFDRNATFLVFRKLYQDVFAFQNYVKAEAEKLRLDTEWLAAKMVGRWKDGTPLVESPDQPNSDISRDSQRINQFGYQSDPRGMRCPLGAHIRRANPRDSLPGGIHSVIGHRMMRRGITYGTPYESLADDGIDRGLLFMACVRSIREQFEFVQRLWINDSGFTGSLHPAEKDPLIGNNARAGWMTIPMPGFPRRLQDLPDFVRLRFGEYFLVPGIRALYAISNTSVPIV